MLFILCSVVAALAFTVKSIYAQNYISLPQKRLSSCALLNQKIYCYGGYFKDTRDTSLYVLNILNVTENFATKWENITNAANSNILTINPRTVPQFAATSDGKALLISGGYPWSDNNTSPQHLVYNADANAWTSLPNFSDGPNGNFRQINLATVTYVPDLSKFFFFGGLENYPSNNWYFDTLDNVNITNTTYMATMPKSTIGYYRMTTLDISNGSENPWKIIPQHNAPISSFKTQAAIYHNTSKRIYYFGGKYSNLDANAPINVTFDNVLFFDTTTSTWGTQAFTGSFIPSPRVHHTMTLLSSEKHVLLYGGSPNDEDSCLDFCFTANLENFEWVSCNNIGLPNNGVAYRAQHSAVLDPIKNILYILFGYSSSKYILNTFETVLTLNVSDPSTIAFVDSTTPVETQLPSQSSGSSGAAIGGAVGGAIAGALVVGLIAFFIFKKEKDFKDLDEDHMSVDWDAIEGVYTETYPVTHANLKDVNKPFEPNDKEKEAMIKSSLTLSNTNTAQTIVVPPSISDAVVQQNQATVRGNHVEKPDLG